ncbi:unnamed protein product [Vitrella brassicaformis CCMP3155]|uniref:RAP domain-containing protein n=3 Tax=Vitrella brassicaformis TaxID=1169539 RepID=A0A0G4EC82_VITBC|nr:unnamed protein product [Vitrella brassicaformis CCMP3155]|eukprot:CEL93108.1 unnamed protein product [Vitrella brassicaformis CCMP3155]
MRHPSWRVSGERPPACKIRASTLQFRRLTTSLAVSQPSSPALLRVVPPFTRPFISRDEEKTVRTVLHQVGQYDATTKLSLKIYHLQQLTRTTFKASQLHKDERFTELVRSVESGVANLSPAQLLALALSARKLHIRRPSLWTQVAYHLRRHCKSPSASLAGISLSQVCLSLHALARHRAKVRKIHLNELLRFVLSERHLLNEHDIACVAYAMRKYGLKPSREAMHKASQWTRDRMQKRQRHEQYRLLRNFSEIESRQVLYSKVLRSLSRRLRDKLHFTSPKGVIATLFQFACLGYLPLVTVRRATQHLSGLLHTLDDQSVALLALSFAKWQLPNEALLKRLGKEVGGSAERFARLDSHWLGILLYAYGRLSIRQNDLLRAAADRLRRAPQAFPRIALAQAAWALGRLGVRDVEAWEALGRTFRSRLEYAGTLELANVAHAYGKVGLRDEATLDAIGDKAMDLESGFTCQQVANLLDGFILAGHFRLDLFGRLLAYFVKSETMEGTPVKRFTQMNRLTFTILVEFPELACHAPQSLQLLLSRYNEAFMDKPQRSYHEQLLLCLESLGLEGCVTLLKQKGPYRCDARITGPPDAGPGKVALDLLSEGDYCPLTGELLGPIRLKARHLHSMGWHWVGMRRKPWLRLNTLAERRDALYDTLHGILPSLTKLPISPSLDVAASTATGGPHDLTAALSRTGMRTTTDDAGGGGGGGGAPVGRQLHVLGARDQVDDLGRVTSTNTKRSVSGWSDGVNQSTDDEGAQSEAEADLPENVGFAINWTRPQNRHQSAARRITVSSRRDTQGTESDGEGSAPDTTGEYDDTDYDAVDRSAGGGVDKTWVDYDEPEDLTDLTWGGGQSDGHDEHEDTAGQKTPRALRE